MKLVLTIDVEGKTIRDVFNLIRQMGVAYNSALHGNLDLPIALTAPPIYDGKEVVHLARTEPGKDGDGMYSTLDLVRVPFEKPSGQATQDALELFRKDGAVVQAANLNT